MVPAVGTRVTSPHSAAGTRREPVASEPCARGTAPQATAAAAPPLDPPTEPVGSHGVAGRRKPGRIGRDAVGERRAGRLPDDRETCALEAACERGGPRRPAPCVAKRSKTGPVRRPGDLLTRVLEKDRCASGRSLVQSRHQEADVGVQGLATTDPRIAQLDRARLTRSHRIALVGCTGPSHRTESDRTDAAGWRGHRTPPRHAPSYAAGPSTKRACSARSIWKGVTHFTPTPMQASGILSFLVDGEGTSWVTTVWPFAWAWATM